MKKEKDVKEAVKKILNKVGAYWFMPVQTGYGVQGIPDFIVCLKGVFVAIETKFGGNTLSAHQEIQRNAIIKAFGDYYIVDETNVADLEEQLCAYN